MPYTVTDFLDGIGGSVLRRATLLDLREAEDWQALLETLKTTPVEGPDVLERMREFHDARATPGEKVILACTMVALRRIDRWVTTSLGDLDTVEGEALKACLAALAHGTVSLTVEAEGPPAGPSALRSA